ncbi:MAG: phosphoribosylformylglycinamidine synthase subunit PurQ [Nitrospirae bacterium]|nr:phosphoribosylformylglycinamidine synthase subunit PurQ [Nitrospirota bacterium]
MYGVVVFPGSNCDHDCYHVIKHVTKKPAQFIWHKQDSIDKNIKTIILPGGFSYGDYLRSGALAQFSPIIKAVKKFAQSGGLVIGICNGFQILCEAHMLPGVLMRNKSLKFICKNLPLKVVNNKLPFTKGYKENQVITLPIAHADGNYYAEKETIAELEKYNQIVFRYCSPDGEITDQFNPNGSIGNIAGITNRDGNVLGMMPHPERCAEELLGNTDGKIIFESLGNN